MINGFRMRAKSAGQGLRTSHRGQTAIEFLVIVGISIMLLAIYLATVNDLFGSYSQEKAVFAIQRQALELQKEFLTASIVHDGYERTLSIPERAHGFNYTLNYTPGYLTLTFKGATATVAIPNASGNITKGMRTLRKQNGMITVS